MNLDEQIGRKLKKIRKEKEMTTREVGEKSGVSYSQISRIENGHPASLQALKKLSDSYDITLASLFCEDAEVLEKLKDGGVGWIALGKEMEKRGITPEYIEHLINVIRNLPR
ncbi:helix-turn-helix domain-containing protein [Virgibacillus sp. Bac332]|uniref:helix-turn-helix domain-containing protein n=1 Tax=Virgibacillus sp. Bac332 TaxID=2419842 RepID=UPI000EF4CC58|nr:helix-turn-helix transcriptional regulator [Virgibacillus sp. Bac332]